MFPQRNIRTLWIRFPFACAERPTCQLHFASHLSVRPRQHPARLPVDGRPVNNTHFCLDREAWK